MLSPRHTHGVTNRNAPISLSKSTATNPVVHNRRHVPRRRRSEEGRPKCPGRPNRSSRAAIDHSDTTTGRCVPHGRLAGRCGMRGAAAGASLTAVAEAHGESRGPMSIHPVRAAPRCRATEAGGRGRGPCAPCRPCGRQRRMRLLAFAYGRCEVLGHGLVSCCGPSFPPMIDR
jgi:hypothetical protein